MKVLMREFQEYRWLPNRQTIREFAAALQIQMNKMLGGNSNEPLSAHAKAILAERLLNGIKQARPKFGASLEFFLDGEERTLKELAAIAESKYDLFRVNSERLEEENFDGDLIFFNEERQSGDSQYRDEREYCDEFQDQNNQEYEIPDYETLVEHYLQCMENNCPASAMKKNNKNENNHLEDHWDMFNTDDLNEEEDYFKDEKYNERQDEEAWSINEPDEDYDEAHDDEYYYW